MRKIIGGILIVIGISIVGAAIGMRIYGESKQKTMMKKYEKSIKNYDASKEIKNNSSPSHKAPEETTGVVGIIRIPKIDLKVAIGEGVDMDTLKFAVGHFPNTAMPGETGNFCVAGHRSYTYSEYFNRLDEIDKGDEIYVKNKKGEFKYIVYEKKVVMPSEYSVLDPTKDATLTLVTCTPIRVATHRLIIKARMQ